MFSTLRKLRPVVLGVLAALTLFGGIYVNEPREGVRLAEAAAPEILVQRAEANEPTLFIIVSTASLLTALSIFIASTIITRRALSKPAEHP
ncbi:MAG: hypothetical protein QXS12_06235 [Candidatus Caldarchaeum sp.]